MHIHEPREEVVDGEIDAEAVVGHQQADVSALPLGGVLDGEGVAAQAIELRGDFGRRMGRVRARTAIFHSRRDFACRPKSASFVHERIGSPDKRLGWFDKAPHSIMHGTEEEKDRLHREVVAFLKD